MTKREQCEYVYRGFQHDGRHAMHAMPPKNKERNLAVANWVLAQTTHVVGSKSNFAWR